SAYRSEESPEDPDCLAQANQQCSGTEDSALELSTPFNSYFYANQINPLEQYLPERPTTPANIEENIGRPGSTQNSEISEQPPPLDPSTLNSNELSDAVASLQAQLDRQRQEYAKRPRRHTISSASTHQDRDAQYLDNWRKRIEGIGNLNYPKEAS